MPNFHLGNVTQTILDEYFMASCKLNVGAGSSEREIISLHRSLPCLEMSQ